MLEVLTLFGQSSLEKQMKSLECLSSEVHVCQAHTDHLLMGPLVDMVSS